MFQTGIEKKRDSVVEILKAEILSGNIACGTELTQNELAQSLNVTRTPIREALIHLAYQGLIERLPNNHVRVTAFSNDYFREVFTLCAELEENVLQSDFVFDEKRPRFSDTSEQEMLIHRQICQRLTNTFLRKTLGNLIETYVNFALGCHAYDRKKGVELLKNALQKAPECRREALSQYFSTLERVILEERGGKC